MLGRGGAPSRQKPGWGSYSFCRVYRFAENDFGPTLRLRSGQALSVARVRAPYRRKNAIKENSNATKKSPLYLSFRNKICTPIWSACFPPTGGAHQGTSEPN